MNMLSLILARKDSGKTDICSKVLHRINCLGQWSNNLFVVLYQQYEAPIVSITNFGHSRIINICYKNEVSKRPTFEENSILVFYGI